MIYIEYIQWYNSIHNIYDIYMYIYIYIYENI